MFEILLAGNIKHSSVISNYGFNQFSSVVNGGGEGDICILFYIKCIGKTICIE